MESQELVLIERETKPAEPYLFRGVTTVYRLLDSVEDVDATLREWLDDKEGSRLSKSSYFWGSCDRDRVGRYVTMFLTQGEDLQMAVHYGVPENCLLPPPGHSLQMVGPAISTTHQVSRITEMGCRRSNSEKSR